MRLLLIILGCCFAFSSIAQSTQQHVRLQVTYEQSGQYLEQAVETIEATSKVKSEVTVDYQAGKAVTLLPGFEARSGATFTAEIKSISRDEETSLKLAAFPNPFEQSTTIEYYLPKAAKVTIWVTDAQGQTIGQVIANEEKPAGRHRVDWKPDALGAGIYFPVVEANQQKAVVRVIKK